MPPLKINTISSLLDDDLGAALDRAPFQERLCAVPASVGLVLGGESYLQNLAKILHNRSACNNITMYRHAICLKNRECKNYEYHEKSQPALREPIIEQDAGHDDQHHSKHR